MVALQCGLPTRRELYQRLSFAELMELESVYSIDPWGEHRADLRAGIIAAATVSPHLKRGAKASPVDFMPYATKQKKQTPKQQDAIMRAIGESMKTRKAKHG